MANRVQLSFPGWTAAAAAFVCLAIAIRTALGFVLIARLGIEANLPALTAISWQPLALIALWLTVGAGIWLRKRWASSALWILAITSLALAVAAYVFVSNVSGRTPSLTSLVQSVVLVAVAWSVHVDRATWPIRGVGPTGDPPFPAPHKLKWLPIGAIEAESGELLVCDPAFVLEPGELGVRVDGVRAGVHTIELQIAELPAPWGKRVARARVVWSEFSTATLALVGEAGVDMAMLSICDPARFARMIPYDEVESSRWPWKLLEDDRLWGNCRDARGETVLIAFSSGLGDGTYPVYRLVADGHWVGILIDMADTDPTSPVTF